MTQRDWRLPEHRREGFHRFYTHSLKWKTFPGMVYPVLPAIAREFNLGEDGKAWLAWLNGNTQNVVSSLMLLEAAPRPEKWKDAVNFWNDNFKALEWDTDRRHQKSKFGVATEQWFLDYGYGPADGWARAGGGGWETAWAYSRSQPYMGRLSAWSMLEFARILLGSDIVPDMGSWLLDDVSGSRSHRNGLAVIAGHDAWSWPAEAPFMLGIVPSLNRLAEDLLREAQERNPKMSETVSRLTLESALCTYKSHYKENRRYPNVYADMMYNRVRKAEVRFGRHLGLMWDIRKDVLPDYLRLEDNPLDPGLSPVKQNHFRETGEFLFLHHDWPGTEPSSLEEDMAAGRLPARKDPSWAL
jgi:hypothetical protein